MSKRFPTPRPRRVEDRRNNEAVAELTEELLEQEPTLTRTKAKARAARLVNEGQSRNRHYSRVFLETKPSVRAQPRRNISVLAELRAIVQHPSIAWVMSLLVSSKYGRPARRTLIVATLMKMAYFGRPDFLYAIKEFEGNNRYGWVFGNPTGPQCLSSRYHSLGAITKRVKPGAAIHANLDLIDEILAMKNPKTGKQMYPDAFTRCAVDGSLIPADVPQYGPRGDSPRERKRNEREIAGEHRPMAQYVWYSKSSGSAPADGPPAKDLMVKSCFGYKLVVIVCMDTGVPIIWTVIPASGDERLALRELLAALYRLRPKFPMEYIVGDGLYPMADETLRIPYEEYGIHPVFPRRAGRSADNPWAETDGVPTCQHGLMELHKEGEFWGAKRRHEHDVKPGSPPPAGKGKNPRLRWRCPVKDPEVPKCPEVATYLKEDWHLNTYLPHAGGSKKTALRYVLLARRNAVESLFSQLKHLGVGAPWPNRTKWGGDDALKWIVSLALLQVTARRVVHLNGAYAEALNEAYEAGHLTDNEMRTFRGLLPDTDELPLRGVAGAPGPPSTWSIDADLPIDREYLLPSLLEYSDRPDRDRTSPSK